MRTSILSRGFNISYRTEGSGDPLLLFQGWSRQADDWWERGYVEALATEYRVLAVDRLGHGQSDKPHDPTLYLEELIVRSTRPANATATPGRCRVTISHPNEYQATGQAVAATMSQWSDGTARKPRLHPMGSVVEPERFLRELTAVGFQVGQ